MRDEIIKSFKLETRINDMKEINGYIENVCAVYFFHSFCKITACEKCKMLPLRITSQGIIKPCLLYDTYDVPILEGNISDAFQKAISMNVQCGNI